MVLREYGETNMLKHWTDTQQRGCWEGLSGLEQEKKGRGNKRREREREREKG